MEDVPDGHHRRARGRRRRASRPTGTRSRCPAARSPRPLELAGPTEAIGLVVALVVLVVTFGSLLAAGMPILTALLGVGIGVAGVLSLSAITDDLVVDADPRAHARPRGRHRLRAVPALPAPPAAGRRHGPGDVRRPRGRHRGQRGRVRRHHRRHRARRASRSPASRSWRPWVSPPPPRSSSRCSVAITLLPAIMGFAGERLRPRGRALRQAEHSREAPQPLGRVRHHAPDRHARRQRRACCSPSRSPR